MCHALSVCTCHSTVYHVQCTPYKQHCCLHVVQQCLHFTVSTRESTRNITSGAYRYDTVTLGRTIWLCKLKLAHNVETKQYTVWHNMLIVCSGTSLLVYKRHPLITCTCVKCDTQTKQACGYKNSWNDVGCWVKVQCIVHGLQIYKAVWEIFRQNSDSLHTKCIYITIDNQRHYAQEMKTIVKWVNKENIKFYGLKMPCMYRLVKSSALKLS